MKLTFTLLLLCLGLPSVVAFHVQPSLQRVTTHRMAVSDDRVRQAGAGIALVPTGNRQLFDPELEGKCSGTGSLDSRLSQGAQYQYYYDSYLATVPELLPSSPPSVLDDAQHWLEDIGLPSNTVKPKEPLPAQVLGRARLIGDDAPGDIQHIVLQLPAAFGHYVEGQSLSVIPPGLDTTTGKPHKPRLYSIASTRYGDLLDGRTVSLCVRRAEYYDPITGVADPEKQGVCSNFLCNTQVGDVVQVAGPVGKTMLLPEDPSKDIIMVATGTGIAPFRGFLHRLFMENTVSRHLFNAKAWLILGVPVRSGLLYQEELQAMQQNNQQARQQQGSVADLEVTYAISREMKNAQGGKLYVQDVLAARADELFSKLDHGAVIYFCGLKGMMPGILTALEQVATRQGIDWSTKLKEWQANHQWHVEVY
ncbi:ferredoxin--NADP+ reductase [Fistulifera solaris]|uniref:ferredoxin--NADP(+) reductase n=1 Tax=Fistulifera solaris TaxID=1519565 RepID=A0A1Z5KLK6_FISSO|nr:ferredoxin--NADP+ reductase [Fistulifera solaris]|eukprot:GAX27166.1 ferredoxin--NADP+ reductase [Fistulifera solaris]